MDLETAHALCDAAWMTIAERRDPRSGATVPVPPEVPCGLRSSQARFSDSFPVLKHLGRALDLAREAGFAELADGLECLASTVPWSQNPSYDETNCTRDFLDGYAYAGLAGPEGPIVCAAPRGGFMLMGPNVTYPGHRHGPREVYFVLTPGVRWRLDDGAWFDVGAGEIVVHEPWVTHAMETGPEPMLAFAGWMEPGDRRAIDWTGGDA